MGLLKATDLTSFIFGATIRFNDRTYTLVILSSTICLHAKRIHQNNFQFVTFAFLAIIRLKHSTDPSYPMEQCQQLVSVESIDIYKSTMGHSIMLVGIIFGIVLTFALYTLGIFCLGFSFGRRTNASRPDGGNDKVAIDK